MKTISFIIPCYNEEKRLSKTFEALRLAQGKPFRGLKLSEIIFVDDGSTDRTFEKIQKWISQHSQEFNNKLSLISYKPNRGKGYAIKEGMLESTSDYALFFDADISTPLSEIKKFLPYFKKGAPIVVGTRKNGASTVLVHQPLYRELLGRTFTKIAQIVLGIEVTDFTCGFKAFSKNAALQIFKNAKINGWGYDAEILFLAKKGGFSVYEVPVIWSNDNGTRVKLVKAIFRTLYELFRIQFIHSIKPNLTEIIPRYNNCQDKSARLTASIQNLSL